VRWRPLKARWLADAPSIRIAGPGRTATLIADLLDAHDYLAERVDLEVTELEAGETTLTGFDVHSRDVRHWMAGFGYRLSQAESSGPSVVFSGDTAADPAFLSLADGADVLAHDCSFPDDVETDNHPTPSSLGLALSAADIEVGTVYLTHLYPQTDGRHGEMLTSIGEHYAGDVALASDGLAVDL